MRIRVPRGFKPRDWARAAYAKYLRHEHVDFAVNACPGAGKTKFAVMLAFNEMHRGAVDRIDVVGPSTHICEQWMREMATWGVSLDPENLRESRDCHGRVMTYQKLGMDPEAFTLPAGRRSLVIMDEIHHAGDAKSWGEGLRQAFDKATRRLLLSGTPFRSDNSTIPFIRYSDGQRGTSISDYTYGYGDALKADYCAPLYFPHHEGEFHWERDGKEYKADFHKKLTRSLTADRVRTALEPTGDYVRTMLREAHRHLMELRDNHPEAAAIVFCKDVKSVRAIARVLHEISGTKPTTVSVDDPDAGERIRRFRAGFEPWIVSVKMVSEGVDIPRLRVGVFLTNVKTEMFFRQAAGRLVRLVPGLKDQSGYLYIPSIPRLVSFASEMQRERKHFVENKNKEGMMSLPLEDEREEPEDSENAYRFLGSAGERAGVIEVAPVDKETGQHFFDFAADLVETEPEAPAPPPPTEAMLLHEQKEQVRKRGGRISSLVRQVSLKHGFEFGQIHGRLNRYQRVEAQANCTLEQLRRREKLLERWLKTGVAPD